MSLHSVSPIASIPADPPTGSANPAVATTAASALTAVAPIPESFTTIQDFALLFKALASGNVSQAQAALSTVLSDLAVHTPDAPTTPHPAAVLNALVTQMHQSLMSSGPDAALHDLATFVVRTAPTSGTMVNTTI